MSAESGLANNSLYRIPNDNHPIDPRVVFYRKQTDASIVRGDVARTRSYGIVRVYIQVIIL